VIEVTSEAELVAALRAIPAANVVAVEGHSLSGKSTTSRHLAAALSWQLIGTDAFAQQGCKAPTYVACLDVGRLAVAIAGRGQAPLLVEGICVRDTLEAVDVVPSLYVYIKRITQAGRWAEDPESAPSLSDLSLVDRWSATYHSRAKPLERADIVFARRDT
jgi:hypothetical protein